MKRITVKCLMSLLSFLFLMYAFHSSFVLCNRTVLFNRVIESKSERMLIAVYNDPHFKYEERTILNAYTGNRIHSFVIRNVRESSNVMIFCHGNSGSIGKMTNKAKKMAKELSTDVILFDYAGYGTSTGVSTSDDSMVSDAFLVYRTFHDRTKPFHVYGISLGGCIALKLAAKIHCKGVIVENPVYRLEDLIKKHFVFGKINLLMRMILNGRPWLFSSFDATNDAKCIDVPVLILCTERDKYVCSEQSKMLKKDLREQAVLHVFNGKKVSHTNAWKTVPNYFRILHLFFEQTKQF
jgi:alpha-beta hydrolase superfamily lysophospholipase